ncbi:MAG: hypothetical protein A2589_02190 [Candidatus Vogelbacteria bacterium RIFOXYD1_FULL_46_19]|uniref:Uncharacterized protein n=1 Tax=Candidatus Vogelbacteria bacterium RIFOXYD1_FULL_46_19 TaxID=1802439 RepID=A0A1G2QGA3_9BACT|nr:MAG: hypothetical protein A2589_02190 [Candidatus Vogelbacteria bacterium RIFOXYD1_FULL_46_19]
MPVFIAGGCTHIKTFCLWSYAPAGCKWRQLQNQKSRPLGLGFLFKKIFNDDDKNLKSQKFL